MGEGTRGMPFLKEQEEAQEEAEAHVLRRKQP
jgi:hypothetical protein